MAEEHRKLGIIAEEIWRDEHHMTKWVLPGTWSISLSLTPHLLYLTLECLLPREHWWIRNLDPWPQSLSRRRGSVFLFWCILKDMYVSVIVTYLCNLSTEEEEVGGQPGLHSKSGPAWATWDLDSRGWHLYVFFQVSFINCGGNLSYRNKTVQLATSGKERCLVPNLVAYISKGSTWWKERTQLLQVFME